MLSLFALTAEEIYKNLSPSENLLNHTNIPVFLYSNTQQE